MNVLKNKNIQTILIFVVVILITTFVIQQFKNETIIKGDYSSYGVSKKQPIVIFTVEWCTACTALKAYLDKNNINYVNLDVDKTENAATLFKRTKQTSYPIIIIMDTMIIGFNETEIENKIQTLNFDDPN